MRLCGPALAWAAEYSARRARADDDGRKGTEVGASARKDKLSSSLLIGNWPGKLGVNILLCCGAVVGRLLGGRSLGWPWLKFQLEKPEWRLGVGLRGGR